MLAGDVVLTPNWSWHSHINEGRQRAYWLDFLDVPLVRLLNLMSREERTDDPSSGAVLSPSSPMRFPWCDTERRLLEQGAADGGSCPGVEIELGSPALETMALFMRRLPPGTSITCGKTLAHNLYAVVRGRGVTDVDGERYEWRRGDVFVVPAGHGCTHCANDDAVLFRVTDAPVMQKLGFSKTDLSTQQHALVLEPAPA
jgi:gentisate 1,2-dioxygenase